ncbi:Zinc finger CCHC-type [Trinorchestia longiramus]|nr:Zinc finger CCHC-type [Trinorchestia longiramus]
MDGKSLIKIYSFAGTQCSSHIYVGFTRYAVFPFNAPPRRCYRCQRLGHVAVNCNLPLRCLVCSGPHTKDECFAEPGQEKCANYHQTHIASSKECPAIRNAAAIQNFQRSGVGFEAAKHKDKLWDIVQGTETISSTADEAARRKFESRRDLALATIVLEVDQSQLYLLGEPTDPVEVWRKFQNTFQKKSWANKLRLKKKLFNMKLKNGQNLQDHLKVFVELFEELAIIGDAMVEEERVIILLSSLPDRVSTLVTALEAHEKIPAWEVVTERLLNEERRQRGGHGTSDSSEKFLASFKRNKKLIKCFECCEEGHIKRQCRVYEERLKKENRTFKANKAVDARSSSTGETIMFTSAFPIDNVDCDSWIVDSGAIQHMCNKKSQFSSYSDLSSPVRVEIGDGRALKGVGVGDVRLKLTLPNMQDKLWDIVQGTETMSSTADEAARRKFESRRDLDLGKQI